MDDDALVIKGLLSIARVEVCRSGNWTGDGVLVRAPPPWDTGPTDPGVVEMDGEGGINDFISSCVMLGIEGGAVATGSGLTLRDFKPVIIQR